MKEKGLRHLFINELCRGQIGRQGLGFIKGQKRIDQMTKIEHSPNSVSSLTRDISEEHLIVSLYGMVKGRFLGWETAMQMDTRWNKLLYSWSPDMLKFYLNAIQDTLPSPANLKTWNNHSLGQCSLCGYNCCTLLHIFSCCQYSLRTGRYMNWRHDMVLLAIVHQLVSAIIKARRLL